MSTLPPRTPENVHQLYFDPGFVSCDIAIDSFNERTFVAGFYFDEKTKSLTQPHVAIYQNTTIIENKLVCDNEPIRCIAINRKGSIICGVLKGTLYVFDPQFNKVKSISIPSSPSRLVCSKIDDFVYVLDKKGCQILTIDITTGKTMDTKKFKTIPSGLAYDSLFNKLIVSEPELNCISYLDPGSLSAEGELDCLFTNKIPLLCHGSGHYFLVNQESKCIDVYVQPFEKLGLPLVLVCSIKNPSSSTGFLNLTSMTFDSSAQNLLLTTKTELNVVKIPLFFEMKIKVMQGRDLISKDFLGKSDPYVTIEFPTGPIQKTDIKKSTLNPKWNQDLVGHFYYDDNDHIILNCIDYDKGKKDDNMGCHKFSIRELVTYFTDSDNLSSGLPKEEWLKLAPLKKEKVKGNISVEYYVRPTSIHHAQGKHQHQEQCEI